MREVHFIRSVWAERQLAKLCPNNNISKLDEVLATEDFDKQISTIERIIIILNEAYCRKEKFLNPNFDEKPITIEELDCLTEDELMELSNKAFESFSDDGKVEIEIEPKNEKAEPMTESI